jgi:hypothetical protein
MWGKLGGASASALSGMNGAGGGGDFAAMLKKLMASQATGPSSGQLTGRSAGTYAIK